MSRVQLKDISRVWGASVGVKQMSLDIAEGEFLVLLGPSGCGKTTTMRMVAGLEEPSTGEVQSHEVILPARLVARSSSAYRNIVEVPA